MQLKLTALIATIAAAGVQALILDTPTSVIDGEPNTVFFQGQPGDQPFTLLLSNPALDETFAFAASVDPSVQSSITVNLFCINSDHLAGWHWVAANPTNNTDIIAETAEFTITQGPAC